MSAGFIEFEFDLPDALLQSLIAIFDSMTSAPLTAVNLADVPDAQGVYQLLLDGKVVYIGKTDGEAGLKQRLSRHALTIQHRKNLPVANVSFKAVRVFVFTAMDLETQLIAHYKGHAPLNWNNSGFGSNDPGRNRDDTALRAGHFDLLYPIDLDEPIDIAAPAGGSVAATLTILRGHLPYTLRFEGETARKPHPELMATVMPNVANPTSTRQLLLAVLTVLPEGWQATCLAGRVILYKEDRPYGSGTIIGKSGTQP
jgi:hypothetical protein